MVDVRALLEDLIRRGSNGLKGDLAEALATAVGAQASPDGTVATQVVREIAAELPGFDWHEWADQDRLDAEDVSAVFDDGLCGGVVEWLIEAEFGLEELFSGPEGTVPMMADVGVTISEFTLGNSVFFLWTGPAEMGEPEVWFAHDVGDTDQRRRALLAELEPNSGYGGRVHMPDMPDIERAARRKAENTGYAPWDDEQLTRLLDSFRSLADLRHAKLEQAAGFLNGDPGRAETLLARVWTERGVSWEAPEEERDAIWAITERRRW